MTQTMARINQIGDTLFTSHQTLAPLLGLEADALAEMVQRLFDNDRRVADLYQDAFMADPETCVLWISDTGIGCLLQRIPGRQVDSESLQLVRDCLKGEALVLEVAA